MKDSLQPVAREAYRGVLRAATAALGPARVRTLEARLRYRMPFDLERPTTLPEKVAWLELNTDQTLAARLSDKIEVRDYVRALGLGDYLIPTCGGPWESPADLDFSGLPERFVMKAAHGSAMNLVHDGSSALDVRHLQRTAARWLRRDYARAAVEPHYRLIPRRVYCETFIDAPGGLVDYKFHCFNGVPHFILVTSERQGGLKRNLFDLNWKEIPGLRPGVDRADAVPRPPQLDEMTEAARALSQDLPFTRVDLYNVNETVLFGELTFSPAGGLFPSFTKEMHVKYGEVLRLP